jgi:hypothetical protein
MGWYRKSTTWGWTIIFITIVALIMYAAVAYTLWHVISEWKNDRPFALVDPSDPIHLMMVSSTRDHNDDEGNLDDFLGGFGSDGPQNNEDLRVKLTDVLPGQQEQQKFVRKRFKVTNN